MNLGLDELMIVNGGRAPPARARWFLGDDGAVYRLDHPPGALALGDATSPNDSVPVPRFFLGHDGTLYRTR